MKKIIIITLLFVCSAVVNAQEVNVATANLDRLNYKSGAILLYYGENRIVRKCYPYSVKFKKEVSEDSIATTLKNKIAAYDPYMYFEFKEGYDCNSAEGYLLKKGVSKMNIGGCQYVDFSKNPNGTGDYNGTAAWNNPANVTDSHVDQLPTWSWKMVNDIVKQRQLALEKDGWQKIYSEYNLAGGPDDNRWVGKRVSASPDSMYMAISTVINSKFLLRVINADDLDAEGNPSFVYDSEFNGDVLAESTPFTPEKKLNKLIFAGVSNDKVNTNNAGIIVFRKKYSIQDEFESILQDAKSNFSHYRLYETKDPNGVPVFAARKVMGLKKPTIFSKDQKKWTFIQSCEKTDANAGKIKGELLKIIDSYVKTGNYLTESGPYNGDMYHRLMDKKNKILFQMVETPKEIQSLFFSEAVQPEPAKENVLKNEIGEFLDPAKNYVFKNWNWAKIAFKWRWLETPDNDENVSRRLANENLLVAQKIPEYTWALAEPNVKIGDNYEFATVVTLSKQFNLDCGQGLIIQFKDGKKGDPSYLFFIINPIKQTYWFGSQNPNNNKWVTHNHYKGTEYNIFSDVINKYNTITNNAPPAQNMIAVKKEGNKFLLYINKHLVETVELNKNNEALKNFEGIGIVTVHKQVANFENISFYIE